eukprot:TRINITY_DN60775_c0_g1_i1.p1 TRINITY_DN60775_c0_g1~~TRINITY_DN60775_c0_g1_i1.p1  ORF type:complete len:407 (+),score=82.20 TRINITY_DN60775_c0_g1_i1:100-1320(+)
MGSPSVTTLLFKAVGFPQFEVAVDLSSTVGDVKVEATAGCDIDPEVMRIIFRGRVLPDDATLESCGVTGAEALHIARGQRSSQTAVVPVPTSPPCQSNVATQENHVVNSISLTIKGPEGAEAVLTALVAESPIDVVRCKAGELLGVPSEQIHLVHRGRVVSAWPAATLAECGFEDGAVVRVARRAAGKQLTDGSTTVTGNSTTATAVDTTESGPMPMAWQNSGFTAEQTHLIRDAFARGALPEQVAEALAGAGPAPRQPAPRRPPGVMGDDMQERLDREVRDMRRHVRQLVRERLQGDDGARLRDRLGLPGGVEDDDGDGEDDDMEMFDEIAQIMAQARARGAPVPNPETFVARSLARAQERRVLQERLRREMGDIDPELEDAVTAAEVSAAASARAPKRLGSGGQ